MAALRQRRQGPSPQGVVRRAAQAVPGSASSGGGSGGLKSRAAPTSADGGSVGWSVPVKVARRRVPGSALGGVAQFSAASGSQGAGKGGSSGSEGVPVKIGRAGVRVDAALSDSAGLTQPVGREPAEGCGTGRAGVIASETSSGMGLKSGKGGCGLAEKGISHSILNINPFAALGSVVEDGGPLVIRDACPGPHKRARPVEYQAPRVISKPEKRKGKGKAAASQSPAVCFPSSGLVSLPSFSKGVGQEVEMSSPEGMVGESGDCLDSGDIAMGSGFLEEAQSPRACVAAEGLEAASSLNAEDDIPSLGCQSDFAMVEDQAEVPASSSL